MFPGSFFKGASPKCFEGEVVMADFFLGCDVSKGYADFVLLDAHKKVVESGFQLDDTSEGHAKLCAFLKDFYEAHENTTIYFGLESTGGYENNWLALLIRLSEVYNLKVTRVDPLAVKRYREACKKNVVTDAVSAHTIAHYLGAFFNELNFKQDIEFGAMRRQWNLMQLLIKQCTQLSNELGFLLYQSHPELVRYCKDGMPKWVLYLLKKYPTSARLSRAKVSAVAKVPYITLEQATKLVEAAKSNVASCVSETDEAIINVATRQLINLTDTIAEQKKMLLKNNTTPEVTLLASVPGIGEYSAIGLMTTIIHIERFANAKKLVSFCGIHPIFKESGDGQTAPRMSKCGHTQPRALLYMAVLSGLSCNEVIKATYARSIKKGMKPKAAIGVCMHKLLRIIYGILKSKKPFDQVIDQSYQMRSKRIKKETGKNNSRRMQSYDSAAPVSRRQKRKREIKKGGKYEPQKNNVLECGVIDTLPSQKHTTLPGTNAREINTLVSVDKIINELVEADFHV
jgi:transposase